MINILFVIDKYIDKHTKTMSSDLTGEMLTCKQSGLFTPSFLYTDECNNINDDLKTYLYYYKIDAIFFSYFAGDPRLNPNVDTLQYIKTGYPTTKLVFMWWDVLFHQYIRDCIKQTDDFADLHITFDGSNLKECNLSQRGVSFICPQPDNLFFPDEKTIDVSFLGRVNTYNDRCMYLKYLLGNGININIRGGRAEEYLSDEEYAKILRQSKITINFPLAQSGIVYQLKEKVFQALVCKTLLLEMENPLTKEYLTPGYDYVEYSTPHNLLNEIQFCLEYEKYRQETTEHGYKKYHQKYHHSIMWNYIKEEILKL